jgi:uncharacterized membrane protein
MKIRIIGIIFVLAILGAVFVVTQDEGPQQVAPTGSSQPVDDGAGALKGLKIN